MKHLITTSLSLLSLVLFVGCGNSTLETPSQNSVLNKISSSHSDKKDGAMQKGLDGWLTKEWSPTIKKDEKIRQEYIEKKGNPFTLQEYVDKSAAYMSIKGDDDANSNVKKMESMPMIGK
jgi:hypothetical protein